ncbi:DUF433 domain-containing protein [Microcoleus vaginatus]|uniref:DUF433 domain-containing protein n=1 Tax=Microcoleus vaginatus TaxID=119532 RepID=UPI0032AC8616
MTQNNLLSRISIDSNICFGKPCIRGHRIWVSLILDFLASGMTFEELLEEYPGMNEKTFWLVLLMGLSWQEIVTLFLLHHHQSNIIKHPLNTNILLHISNNSFLNFCG